MQTHIQSLLQHRNPLWSSEEQYDARKTASDAPMRKNIPDKPIMHNVLWSLLLWSILTMGFNSCKISECRKAEEAEYAKYRYALANDSIRNDSNRNEIIRTETWYLNFDCKHHYTKKYIRKHLGEPFRIYINDENDTTPDIRDYKPFHYEDWLYPAYLEYHPNEKPFIGALLVLRFEHNKSIMLEDDCPRHDEYSCREYKVIDDPEKDVNWIFHLINTDSFDLKCPYILRNEEKFYWTF